MNVVCELLTLVNIFSPIYYDIFPSLDTAYIFSLLFDDWVANDRILQ